MRKVMKPTPEDLRALKARHHLTAATMAEPLYGVSKKSIENWVGGRRECPPLAWWALVLHFESIDLRDARCPYCLEKFENLFGRGFDVVHPHEARPS